MKITELMAAAAAVEGPSQAVTKAARPAASTAADATQQWQQDQQQQPRALAVSGTDLQARGRKRGYFEQETGMPCEYVPGMALFASETCKNLHGMSTWHLLEDGRHGEEYASPNVQISGPDHVTDVSLGCSCRVQAMKPLPL